MTETEAPVKELSGFAFDRAKRFDHVLDRLTQAESLYEHYKPQGYLTAVNWIHDGEKHRQLIDENLIHALKGTAVTLFCDLRDAGEEALALDLVDQHRQQEAELASLDEQGTPTP